MIQPYDRSNGGLRSRLWSAALRAAALMLPILAIGQVRLSGNALPRDLALEAAGAAVRSGEAMGYRASIVDAAGVERVALRGDHSTIHTRETAFKKAGTVAMPGPILGRTTTVALTDIVDKTPTGPALSSLSNVILLAGGVAIRSAKETLAALDGGWRARRHARRSLLSSGRDQGPR